jgi:tripartite-type tricarboxylate transporter receptor subunit TctC
MRLALVSPSSVLSWVSPRHFPVATVTIMVPFPPGSTRTSSRARSRRSCRSRWASGRRRKPAGAGGNVGAALVARGDASGHQVLMAPSAILATNQWLYKEPATTRRKDLTPVINAATTPNVWVAHPDTPVKTIRDVVAQPRRNPARSRSPRAETAPPATCAASC